MGSSIGRGEGGRGGRGAAGSLQPMPSLSTAAPRNPLPGGGPGTGRRPRCLGDNLAMPTDGTDPQATQAELAPLPRRIVELLDARGVAYRLLRHPPVRTSEEAS